MAGEGNPGGGVAGGRWLLGGKIPMGWESSFPSCAEAQAKDENGPDGVGRPKSVGNGVKQYVGQHGGLRDRGGGLGGHLKSGHRRSPQNWPMVSRVRTRFLIIYFARMEQAISFINAPGGRSG